MALRTYTSWDLPRSREIKMAEPALCSETAKQRGGDWSLCHFWVSSSSHLCCAMNEARAEQINRYFSFKRSMNRLRIIKHKSSIFYERQRQFDKFILVSRINIELGNRRIHLKYMFWTCIMKSTEQKKNDMTLLPLIRVTALLKILVVAEKRESVKHSTSQGPISVKSTQIKKPRKNC